MSSPALPVVAVVDHVRRERYRRFLPVAVLRIRLRPGSTWALTAFTPHVQGALLRQGIAVGQQGSSMTPAEAADLVARTRPDAPRGPS